MSSFRQTIWVSVLLASAALVTGCQSEKDRAEKKTSSAKSATQTVPSQVEDTPMPLPRTESMAPSASKPATQHRSVASTKGTHTKPTHAKPTKNAKSKAHADAKSATKNAAKPSDTKKFTSYGEGAEGAGITDPVDTAQTAKGTTSSVRK
jgi:hypothetical protein